MMIIYPFKVNNITHLQQRPYMFPTEQNISLGVEEKTCGCSLIVSQGHYRAPLAWQTDDCCQHDICNLRAMLFHLPRHAIGQAASHACLDRTEHRLFPPWVKADEHNRRHLWPKLLEHQMRSMVVCIQHRCAFSYEIHTNAWVAIWESLLVKSTECNCCTLNRYSESIPIADVSMEITHYKFLTICSSEIDNSVIIHFYECTTFICSGQLSSDLTF